MREIKFRAWDGSRFIYLEVGGPSQFELCGDGIYVYNSMGNSVKSDIKEIQQYTGLKDKNGVEIYEGDLLKCFIGRKAVIALVEFEGWGFLPFSEQTGDLADCYSEFNYDGFEVIGNIYESPELLEQD